MNLLKNEKSPYLRQHKDNPVHWMPWGEDALTRARTENKPILLSIGYAACHWCHVMAHESFENIDTAQIMNDHFINIKVDREERPDIDALYQQSLALMGQQGGWPLTMFLDSHAKPFFGGTYFPPFPRHGLPSFPQILHGVAESFKTEQDKITHNTDRMVEALTHLQSPPQGQGLSMQHLQQASDFYLSKYDNVYGGFGHAPKFPQFNILNFLWAQYIQTGKDSFKSSVIHTLTQMCQGGIYDHIGGGLCRYSVDAEFLIPHFEKMLVDNVLLLSLLTHVTQETGNPLFFDRIHETFDFLMTNMWIEENHFCGFATSLNADSINDFGTPQEGAFYIWTSAEIDTVLGTESDAFKKIYDITSFGNWSDGNTAHKTAVNIPNRLKQPGRLNEKQERTFKQQLKKLNDARNTRAKPTRDDKILTDINAMMVKTLCDMGFILENQRYIDIATKVFHSLIHTVMQDTGHLSHSFCDGTKNNIAFLDDYAHMIHAAITLYTVTQDDIFLTHIQKWMTILENEFWDDIHGGFYQTSKHQTDILIRQKSCDDHATFNANAVMISVITKCDHLNIKTKITADQIFKAFSHHVDDFLFGRAHLLQCANFAEHPMHITLNGDADMFLDILRKLYIPTLCPLQIKAEKDDNSTPSALICVGQRCLPPIETQTAFRQALLKERQHQNRLAANDL